MTKSSWAALMVTAASSLVACAVDTDGLGGTGWGGAGEIEIGGVEQSITQGVATMARPAIGRFFRRGWSYCTATLITPRYVLTAAHCLNDLDYKDVEVASNDYFLVTLADGSPQWIRPDKYFSFGAYFEEKIFNGLSSDVALLRLSSGFAASVASPIAIADTRSRSGTAWSTRFGYGCNDRDEIKWTGTGGGAKRYASLRGLASNFLCPGDSGGPTMKGQGESSAPIYAVHSGTSFDLSAGGLFDVVADATYHKKYIEAVMTSWDGDTMHDVDRLGADYKDVPSAANLCPGFCAAEDRCQSWTWYDGVCHLKDAIPGFTPLIGAYSGIKPNRVDDDEIGYDRPGSGYNTFAVANQTACNTECANDYRCQSYTYGLNSAGQRTCWLKDEQPPLARNANLRSKTKRGFRMNRFRTGATLFHQFSYSMPSPEICQSDCAKRSECKSWNYTSPTRSLPAICKLYTTVGTEATSAGYVSGLKGREFY